MIITQDFPKGLTDIKYTEDDIKLLAKKLNWVGIGTENDPIIIPSSTGLPQKFAIIRSKLYVNIKNGTFEKVDFYRCWNISVEECSFKVLNFINSFSNIFKKCTIFKIRFTNSSGNKFKECMVSKVSNVFSKKNHFEDCTLGKRVRKRLDVDIFDVTGYMKILPIAIIILSFFPLFWIFSYFYSSIPLGPNLILPILMILIFIFIYLSLNKIKKITSKESSKSDRNKNKK